MAVMDQEVIETRHGRATRTVKDPVVEEAIRDALRPIGPHHFTRNISDYAGIQLTGAYKEYLEVQIAEMVRQDALRKKQGDLQTKA